MWPPKVGKSFNGPAASGKRMWPPKVGKSFNGDTLFSGLRVSPPIDLSRPYKALQWGYPHHQKQGIPKNIIEDYLILSFRCFQLRAGRRNARRAAIIQKTEALVKS